MKILSTVLVVGCFLGTLRSVSADVVTLQDVDDTYINGSLILGNNNDNFGSSNIFSASQNGSFWSESLIRVNDIFGSGEFQVPENATIVSGQLHLWLELSWGEDPNPYSLFQLDTSWDEATVTSNSFGRVADNVSGPAIDVVAGPTVNPYSTDTLYVFDVTASLLEWQGGGDNHGWGLTSPAPRNEFYSSESGTIARRPYLEVQFTAVPEPGALTLVALGSLVLLSQRRRA